MGSTGERYVLRLNDLINYLLDQNRGLPGDPKGYHSREISQGNR